MLIPITFFSFATYVEDSSQLVADREIDTTYKPRVFACGIAVFGMAFAIVSMVVGEDSWLTMHKQGKNIHSASVPATKT